MSTKLRCRNCCKSTDELNDIASTIQAYTSIHFNREEWIKLRFVCMLYSCIIFMWTIMDSIFSDRTLFYFIYATHWILLLTSMLYLICSYVITLVIHERIGTNHDENHTKITIINNKRDNKNNHFQDMHLQQTDNHIPSLTELGLFKWNQFIVFLQNASLSPCIVFPVIFWFVVFPNIGSNHTWYDILLEFHIHAVIPILILFDFTFSSRTVLYIDIYQPLIVGILYCLWTYLIFTDATSSSESEADSNENKPSYFYGRYYYFEINDFVIWFIFNLSALCGIHLIFSLIKTKVLSKHFLPIQLSSNHTVLIDRNGHIVDSKHKQYEKIKPLKPKKRSSKKSKRKKDEVVPSDEEEVELNVNHDEQLENEQQSKDKKHGKSKRSKKGKKKHVKKEKSPSVVDENEIEEQVQNEKPSKPQKQNKTNTRDEHREHEDDAKEDKALIAANEQDRSRTPKPVKQAAASTNSIKQGFKNLIAIVDAEKTDKQYNRQQNESDEEEESDSSTSSSDDDEEDEEDEDSQEDHRKQHHEQQVKRFYSLKGNESDMMVTDDENAPDAFRAIRTKSMAALLKMSKSLHTVASSYKVSGSYKSEIEYSETSGISDEEIQFGLKSGLYKK